MEEKTFWDKNRYDTTLRELEELSADDTNPRNNPSH
jgi:hypothetical protein